jgi:hypothetical protein
VRGCLPSLAICAIAVAPAALWAFVEGVGDHNFVRFGLGAGLLTALAWLMALRLLRHPLLDELRPIGERIRQWVRRPRAAHGVADERPRAQSRPGTDADRP